MMTPYLAASILLWSFALPGVWTIDSETEMKIDEFVEALLGCRDLVGMNLAIVQNGQTQLTKGYGLKNQVTNEKVTGQTLFSIASLTKAFADTLLGTLLEETGLSWDTRVRDILGSGFYFSDGLRSNHSTLRDLGSHKMGIPGHSLSRLQGYTRKSLYEKIRFFDAIEGLRTSYRYNNLMYGLIAYITEVVGGKTWEELLREKIFQPLGMNSTSFTHDEEVDSYDIATPYLEYEEGFREVSMELHKIWGVIGGTASILSNAEDMAEWLHLHLNGGTNQDGDRVIPESVLQEIYEGYSVIPQGPSTIPYKRPVIPVTYDHSRYGLGWQTGYYRGLRMHVHTGSSWGFTSILTLLPDVGLGIYSSQNGPDVGYLARRISHMYLMDLMLGQTPWLNTTTACTFPEPWYDDNEAKGGHEAKQTTSSQSGHRATLMDKTPARGAASEPQKVTARSNSQPTHRAALKDKTPARGAASEPEKVTARSNSQPTHRATLKDKTPARGAVSKVDTTEISPYVGTFGNFGYGNVTFFVNENDILELRYGELGRWLLEGTGNDRFFGYGQDIVWHIDLANIIFKNKSSNGRGQFEEVEISLDTTAPPTFTRDLDMADAPPPPNPEDCSTGGNR